MMEEGQLQKRIEETKALSVGTKVRLKEVIDEAAKEIFKAWADGAVVHRGDEHLREVLVKWLGDYV